MLKKARLRGLKGHHAVVRVGTTVVVLLLVMVLFVNWFSMTATQKSFPYSEVDSEFKALTLSRSAPASATTQTEYYLTLAWNTQNGLEMWGFLALLIASAAALVGLSLAIFVAITNKRRPLFFSTVLLVVSVILGLLGVILIDVVGAFMQVREHRSWSPSSGFVLLVAATVVSAASYWLSGRTKSA